LNLVKAMKRPLPTHVIAHPVSIYRNLNDKCLSVLHKQRVAGHAGAVILENVRFRVQEGGRQTVLRTGRKNVHAFVDGILMQCSQDICVPEATDGIQVSYNPRRAGYFYNRETGEPVHQAKLCAITPTGVFAYL